LLRVERRALRQFTQGKEEPAFAEPFMSEPVEKDEKNKKNRPPEGGRYESRDAAAEKRGPGPKHPPKGCEGLRFET
jgi:hypothetical protein